jgi:hypothetical protein
MARVESSQADKVEKNLVKNLVIGYVSAPNANDKLQILKLISHVLDLSPPECDKVGLGSGRSQGSWLGGILPGGSGAGGELCRVSLEMYGSKIALFFNQRRKFQQRKFGSSLRYVPGEGVAAKSGWARLSSHPTGPTDANQCRSTIRTTTHSTNNFGHHPHSDRGRRSANPARQ